MQIIKTSRQSLLSTPTAESQVHSCYKLDSVIRMQNFACYIDDGGITFLDLHDYGSLMGVTNNVDIPLNFQATFWLIFLSLL